MRYLTRQFSRGLAVALALLGGAASQARAQAAQQPTLHVGMLGYAQYMYQMSGTPTGAPASNNFDITRAYIDLKGSIPGGIGVRVTTDVFRVSDSTSNDNGSLAARLKYAYATYTPSGSPLTFKLGQIHTPWLDWIEGMYGYRMQGTMPTERNGFFNSGDLGFGVDGAWGQQMVNMQVGIYNGEGYHGYGDARKDVEGRVSVRLLPSDDHGSRGGLRVTGYGQYGKPTDGGKRYRAIGMLSYHSKRFTIAAEGALRGDSTAGSSTTLRKGRLFAGYAVVRIPNSPVAVLARADLWDPNTSATGDRQTRIIGGVSYDLSSYVRLLADVDAVSYQSGAPSIANALFQMQFTY